MAEPAVVRVERLHKQYETAAGPVHALNDVTLSIFPGEFVAVMGASGSGKSTFMNILGCLDVQTSGEYFLNGTDVRSLDKDRQAKLRNDVIGFVFQSFNLLSRASLLENVGLPLVYSKIGRAERNERAKRMLDSVGLEKYHRSRPNKISGGQQQRVAIARALVNNPRLILADEPTGNLDTKTSGEIMEIFTGLNQRNGITIVLVTHEEDIALHARRRIRFKDGFLVSDDEPRGKPTGSRQ
ncbi:MAG: ABC transporter ATP-binding protein [Nitrospinae bacterium]|nr:ABC transporter ATP-binding protein [Nitrospinota bacterium]